MQSLTFLELAGKIIKEENKPLSSNEIWEIAQSKGYDDLLRKKGGARKTTLRTITAKIYTDMRYEKDSPFVKIGSYPTRFFLRNLHSKNIGS